MVEALLLAIFILLVSVNLIVLFKIRKLQRNITEFITPPRENEPSPLANVVNVVTDQIGRSVAAQAKAALMAHASAAARAEKAVAGDIAEDVASQQPGLAALMQQFPTLTKSIRRNPGLLDVAMSMLPRLMGGKGNGSGKLGSTPDFKL